MPEPAVTFLLTLAAVTPAHWLADHWFQSAHQVDHKGDHSRYGQWTCARHAAVHVLTAAPFLAAVVVLLDTPATITGLLAGQAWTFLSHYAIDRRWTVHRAAVWLSGLGKVQFHDLGTPRHGYTVTARRTHVQVLPGGRVDRHVVEEDVPLDIPVLGTGRYALDQSAHHAALFVTALLTALI